MFAFIYSLGLLGLLSMAFGYPSSTSWLRHSKLYDKAIPLLDKESFVPEQIMSVPFSGKGCVLLSQSNEYDHWLTKAAILIYEHNDKGSKGLILDKPSPVNMGESSPGIGVFKANQLFLGGSEGSDTAVMVHGFSLGVMTRPLGYGIYVGGIKAATEKVERFEASPKDFKFIFNNVQWGPGILEKEVTQGRWDVCCVPPYMLVKQDPKDYQVLWGIARNALRSEGALRNLDIIHEGD